MATDAVSQGINTAETATLTEQTNHKLLKIIRNNFNTRYATQTPSLSGFRDVVSIHGGTEVVDAALLADFRSHVPLSNYSSYEPFIDKFNAQPCRKEDVENLLAPGLPMFFVTTSATTGSTKLLPKYDHGAEVPRYACFDPGSEQSLAALLWCGYRDLKEIEQAPGQIVQKIPVCLATGKYIRRYRGWNIGDDEARMALKMPFYVVPWVATMISHLPSFLVIHGIFFLACQDVDHFYSPFAPFFVDFIRDIDEKWNMLVSCIRDGILPDLEGIDHIRHHLQAHFHADPERAAELSIIGPPSSIEGWASRVWPKAKSLVTICGGVFSLMLPRLRSILGPNIMIHPAGYGASETAIGTSVGIDQPDELTLWSQDVIEFLDISEDESHENIRQAWEVEVGKQYELILTTRDGLWRYQLGDIVSITGFNLKKTSPIFKYAGRRSFVIRLPHAEIRENQLLEAIRAINSEDIIQVQEYTTMIDDRTLPLTLGLFVELNGPVGPNAHLAPQKLFDALFATDIEHRRAFENGQTRLPTIRIVKAGTFGEYRSLRSRVRNIVCGQTKVTMIAVRPELQKLILEGVIHEL